MGTMLKYGSESAKYFVDNNILDKDIADAHNGGDIHIHDKDFYLLTETCCQIDLLKLFKDGFSTGHGHLREPMSIQSYGGPTANFRIHSCKKQDKAGMCRGGKRCLAPQPCPALQVDHSEFLEMLRRVRALPKVKRVFVRSGIRFDYLILEKDPQVMRELIEFHVSGQLKVAPEHCSTQVLDRMGKPHFEVYKKFAKEFYSITEEIGKKQFLVPYLMSSHPGSTVNDAIELSLFLKKEHLHPEQVQDFYPTPGTISTCIFYTGLDPYTRSRRM